MTTESEQFFNRMHGRPANDPYAGGSADEQPFTDRWDVAALRAERQLAVDALREIANQPSLGLPRTIASEALTKLGETP